MCYTGGPAKVSVVSSAFFGTISGSSVANTVSTGPLT
ncbi:TRAP transporter large permease subunit, partial [Okeania sp. SIO2B9]|nr:TRAP transporter large permease subunit [Okeania sp. SIO2B9]